jgi:dihydrofolate synthase/folylpolyglutamate synthase
MQRLKHGPLVEAAGAAELWLDGGHNPAAGEAIAETLVRLPARRTHLIVGMLNTKDVRGFLRPLAPVSESLHAITIPGEKNTLTADETLAAALDTGHRAVAAASVIASVREIAAADPAARILICGSLYLAGQVLRENG